LTGVAIEPPRPKADFTLTDVDGNPYQFARETEGRLTLIYFGYTSCPDICPVHLSQLAEVFDQNSDVARESLVIFVTVDPERDTPETLRDYLANFDRRFVGLTGTDEELEVAQRAAGVPVAFRETDDENYLVAHAGQVVVYAPDGLAYTEYPFGTRQSQWLQDLPILLERTDLP
jgi:protein SCO1/2